MVADGKRYVLPPFQRNTGGYRMILMGFFADGCGVGQASGQFVKKWG